MYEEAFRLGLRNLLTARDLEYSAVAKRAGIRPYTFSKMMNADRKIYAEEVGQICKTLDVSFEEVLQQCQSTPHEPKVH